MVQMAKKRNSRGNLTNHDLSKTKKQNKTKQNKKNLTNHDKFNGHGACE